MSRSKVDLDNLAGVGGQAACGRHRRRVEWFAEACPGGVVRAGLLIRVAAAFRGLPAGRMPAGRGIASLADVPDRHRRDGFSKT